MRWLSEFVFTASAAATGFAMQMDWFARKWDPALGTLLEHARSEFWDSKSMNLRLWCGPVLLLLVFWGLRALLRWAVRRALRSERGTSPYPGPDNWIYAVFLLSLGGAFGFFIDPRVLLILLIVGQGILVWKLTPQLRESVLRDVLPESRPLLGLFLASGFAALIYQVVWQRALFQSFGVNIESVTVIVSVFMFGLGLGSLLGGALSRAFPDRLVELFVVCEVVIGLFGLFSLRLIESVSQATLHSSLGVVTAATFGLLCIPTVMMGATLPILVTHLHRTYRNVGTSLSLLYFINTLGSALASLLTVNLLFLYLGLEGSARVAVLFNLGVAYLGYRLVRSRERSDAAPAAASAPAGGGGRRGRYVWILLVAFAVGFISLSLEILWVRLIAYVTGGRATVFGNLLGCYLIGIALGALLARRHCERDRAGLLRAMAGFLIAAAGVFYFGVALTAWLMGWVGVGMVPLLYFGAGAVALLTGAVFPMVTHFAVTRSRAVGVPVSGVYFANILGATAGPLLTGFYLLEWYGLERNVLQFSLLTLALGLLLAILGRGSTPWPPRWVAATGVALIVGLAGHPWIYDSLLERFFHKHEFRQHGSFADLVQTRSGIVNTIAHPDGGGPVISGGGVFDGRLSTDLTLEHSKIRRAYVIAALHPRPARVLNIGMSGGSWTRVLLNHEAVETMHVIEINPGYLEVMRRYPENGSVLEDPRVKVFVDDGRRWLLRHPEERYDVIVMNATFYWRSQSSNLLSREFLELVKRHLRPGGIFYYNSTSCEDTYLTAAQVFPYATQFESFITVGDAPVTQDPAERMRRLAGYSYRGEPILEWENGRLRPLLEKLSHSDIADRRDRYLGLAGVARVITDNNLASEFKTGRMFYSRRRAWLPVLRRAAE